MRLRRVLVLNKWRRFAPPDKHTPIQLNSTHYTRKTKARRRAMLPLHRLQSCARFSTCGFFIFKPCITLIYHQFTFRSLLIVSAETSPIYSPSFQQEKSSKRSNFLSSIPIGAATSLSIISDMKNCGSPFEYTSFPPGLFKVLDNILHHLSEIKF